MHDLGDLSSESLDVSQNASDHRPWYKLLTRYHWFVLMVAALGWMFDCLDQQLFVLARPAAIKDLVKEEAARSEDSAQLESACRNNATSIFMVGWACGGLFFGVLGDRVGRARTMLITILLYSLFTGLSALSVGFYDFAAYRFLTGLGVGGEFAVGVALIAEVMPARARPNTLALLQALSAVGNISAAFICLGLGMASEAKVIDTPPWRIMFMVGGVPALFLAMLIWAKLKEPEAWQKASHNHDVKKKLGSYADLFRDPVLRRHALLGLVLGCSGIIGLWSVGFFTTDLMRRVREPDETSIVYKEFEAKHESKVKEILAKVEEEKIVHKNFKEEMQRAESADKTFHTNHRSVEAATDAYKQNVKAIWANKELKDLRAEIDTTISARLDRWSSYTSVMFNIGAALGMFGFGALAQRLGRKKTFAIALIAAFVSTAAVSYLLKDLWQLFVLVPIMGFCQLSLFAGYAIYFPELFPTRLRSTGTSFCYNVGRFLAATGPVAKTAIEKMFSATNSPQRYAAMAMSGVFLVGLLVLPFLPETRGEPLPE